MSRDCLDDPVQTRSSSCCLMMGSPWHSMCPIKGATKWHYGMCRPLHSVLSQNTCHLPSVQTRDLMLTVFNSLLDKYEFKFEFLEVTVQKGVRTFFLQQSEDRTVATRM